MTATLSIAQVGILMHNPIMYYFCFQQSERGESAQSHSPPHPETATISPTLSEDKTSLPSQASIHDVIQVINLQKVRKILSHCVTKPIILALRSIKDSNYRNDPKFSDR